MINYVIFDMDGTLFDTERLYKKAWIKASVKWGLSDPEGFYPCVVGVSRAGIIEIMKNTYGADIDYLRFLEQRDEYLKELTAKSVPLKAGCVEILSFLKKNGIRIALATSTRGDTARSNLKRTDIYEYFDAIVSGDMVENGKPAPDIFIKAGELIGADPQQTLICEDSFSGIIGAYSAKMKPVMVIDQLEPTDEIAKLTYAIGNSLFDVMELIKKENKLS